MASVRHHIHALRKRKVVVLFLAVLITLTSTIATQLIRLAPPYQVAIDPRSAAIQFVASDPLPDSSGAYLLQNATVGYAMSYTLFLGTWPKNESRMYPAAFGIFNTEAARIRVTKLDFPDLAAAQKNCIYAYLHKDPRKVSNASVASLLGLTTTARETLGTSSLIYFDGSAGSVNHAADGWVLSSGYSYAGGVPPTILEYSDDNGATRDQATYNTSKSVWVRDLTELNTNGISTMDPIPGSTLANFAWVEVTVDARRPSCTSGTFSAGTIEVFLKSE